MSHHLEEAPGPSNSVASSISTLVDSVIQPDSTAGSDSSRSDLFSRVQTVLITYLTSSPLYKILLASIELSSASHGHVTLKLVVLPIHVNSKAVLHGSVSATLVDLVGGLAVTSTGSPKTGVSTDMHVSFVGTAREGDTLWIDGIAERVGATLAFTRVRIEKEIVAEGGAERALVATGSHTKYVR
ncbi:thioesterase thiol ester dehydrase-isomerase [Mycena metata]|uniref:Thioesterase thiol ester dehydrase-isomerase n=1 Tax=Mycena metata TaxID=1033252 RepID=A0AAD7NSZ0_9AGAR|nr:thioesterase thiol ester dehydrase-isomerase [Mycena metata]